MFHGQEYLLNLEPPKWNKLLDSLYPVSFRIYFSDWSVVKLRWSHFIDAHKLQWLSLMDKIGTRPCLPRKLEGVLALGHLLIAEHNNEREHRCMESSVDLFTRCCKETLKAEIHHTWQDGPLIGEKCSHLPRLSWLFSSLFFLSFLFLLGCCLIEMPTLNEIGWSYSCVGIWLSATPVLLGVNKAVV